MRRTITQYGGSSKSELREFLPSVVVKHPRYDYYLGADLKHASTSTLRSLCNGECSHEDKYKAIFGEEKFDYKTYNNLNWVTIWRSTDSVLRSLYHHYWKDWFHDTSTGFAEFNTYLDWCFGIGRYNCDFYPNESHANLEYRIWQAHITNRYNMIAIDISETNDLIKFWGGSPKHLNRSDTYDGRKSNPFPKESHYNEFVERIDYYKSDWYRVQLMCDKVNVTKFEDFHESATLGRNDVDSTSENSTKGLQESPQ